MPNPRLATRYAKSLKDLAVEENKLDAVYTDMQYLKQVTRQSKEFINVLRSPVIKADKKQSIIDAVIKSNISELTYLFTKLLINKGREEDLPEIISSFIEQYNALKGIHKVTLTTAAPVSDEIKNVMIEKVKSEAHLDNVELETKVNDKLIGGFVLEYNNNLLDASVLRDLNDIKKQFKERNIYVQNIR